MFRNKLSARIRWRLRSVALIMAVALPALVGLAPTRSDAQGPPDVLPGVGPIVLEGDLQTIFEDDEANPRLLHFLDADNRRIPLRFEDGTAPDLPSGTRVRIAGRLADGTVTVTSVTVLADTLPRTWGPKNILIILFNFSNNTTQPFSATTIASVNENVKNYYVENTYGETLLIFTVAGWFTIPATNTTCSYGTWASQADAAAKDAGFNLAAYDRRIYAFPGTGACRWTGLGYLGGSQAFINGSYGTRTLAHELGHTFGAYHSHARRCDSSGCTAVEYGNDRDVMGQSGVVGNMNAFQKERLLWLNYGTTPATRTVSTSGDYWIENYGSSRGSPKALKIWNPTNNTYYYVETRAKMGFDSTVAAGVTIHTAAMSNGNSSYQIDLAPTTTMWDSTLDVGQVFTDDAMSLNVQTLSSNVDGALVRVVFGTIPCTAAAPVVSIASAASMKYTITVKNNNSSTCAPTSFNLGASVPSGWSASFSPVSLSPAPGASASATLTLTAPAGTSGTYAFGVSATDATSGYSGTANGSITVASSLDVTASATMGGNGNNRSVTISTTVKIGTTPLSGASVSVVVTGPNGTSTTLTATTGADGTASVKHMLKPKDPSGTYGVRSTASGSGITGTATTSFVAP